MDGSGKKSTGLGGKDQVVLFLEVYGLLWTVREQVDSWAWVRLASGWLSDLSRCTARFGR